jgi:hypothetical protein
MHFLRSRLSTGKRGGLVLVAGEAWGVRATAAQDRSAWAMANDVAGRHMQGGAGGGGSDKGWGWVTGMWAVGWAGWLGSGPKRKEISLF